MKKGQQFTLPLSDITSSGRVREEFDILELKESIEKYGLLQPIAVSLDKKSGKFNLLDGGRRLKAAQELKLKHIQVFILPPNYDDLTKKEIEMEANTQKPFTFIERNNLIEQIHTLMQSIHGKKTSTSPDAKGWTMDDTAKKLNKSRASISGALEMQEATRLMPELADCKNESDARKMWKQAERGITRELILAEAKTKLHLSPIDIQKRAVEDTYIVGDALELVKEVPDHSQHLVEIDWPFSIGLEDHMGEYEDIKKEDYIPFMQKTLVQAKRILRPDGWLFVWFAAEPWQEETFLEIQKTGLRTRRIPLYWESDHGETRRPEYYLATCQEECYYAGGVDARIVRQGRSNRFDQTPVPAQLKVHRTQKPVTLYDDMFSTFVMPGEETQGTIMFNGSGNALLSFSNLQITGRGYDLKEEYKRFFCMNVQIGTPGEYAGWEK